VWVSCPEEGEDFFRDSHKVSLYLGEGLTGIASADPRWKRPNKLRSCTIGQDLTELQFDSGQLHEKV
jgi:hypothetical protein